MTATRKRISPLEALFGKAIRVPHGEQMAELAWQCSHWNDTTPNGAEGHLHQKRQEWLAPHLAALLGNSLGILDSKAFRDFANVIDAIKEQRANRKYNFAARQFHAKALKLAGELCFEHRLPFGSVLPLTQDEFIDRLGVQKKEHDARCYERRELKRLKELRFSPAKKGRPKRVPANAKS